VEPAVNDPLSTWPQPRPNFDTPRTIPPRGVPFGPQPAPGSSIPSSIPSTIPHWVDPAAVTQPADLDWNGRGLSDPGLPAEDPMELGPVTPPTDLPDLEADLVPENSSIPPRSSIPNGPAVPELAPAPDANPLESLEEPPLEMNEPSSPPAFPDLQDQPELEEPPVGAKSL
jgi:hypothetical protein